MEQTLIFHISDLLAHFSNGAATCIGHSDPHRQISGVEIHDDAEITSSSDCLIITPLAELLDAPHLAKLISTAAAANHSAIAVKVTAELLPLITELSQKHKIPIINIAPEIRWSLFEAEVSRLIGEARSSEQLHIGHNTEPLIALSNELAAFFGGSAVIEDIGRRIVAYSTLPGQTIDQLRIQGILARSVPDTPFNDTQYRRVLQTAEPVFFNRFDKELPRTAIAIRAGAIPLGTIWVIDDRDPSTERHTPEAVSQMQHASQIAAGYLLAELHYRDTNAAPREQRLRKLLAGHNIQGEELAHFNFDPDTGYHLIALRYNPLNNASGALAQLRQTAHRQLALRIPELVSTVYNNLVWLIFPHKSRNLPQELLSSLANLITRSLATQIQIAHAGYTKQAQEIKQLANHAALLFKVSEHHDSTKNKQILTTEQMQTQLLLSKIADATTQNSVLGNPALKAMLSEDPELASTLLCWCQARGNIAASARLLQVHENTVRTRITKVVNHYGIPIEDPDVFLATWLQLRAALNAPN